MRGLGVTVATAVLLATAALAHGQAEYAVKSPCAADLPVNQPLTATTNTPGIVRLHFFYAPGSEVSFWECRGETARLLKRMTSPTEITSLDPATPWRCDRLVRSFAATVTRPDGSYGRGTTDVRTTSCAHRYRLAAPERARRGDRVHVSVFDTWEFGGVRGRVCLSPPRGKRDCRPLRLARQVNVASRDLRLDRRGRWRIDVRLPHARLRGTVAVGVKAVRAPRLPTVLAAGDSTMTGVESFLADDLGGRANTVSGVIPGASVSGGEGWRPVALDQTAVVSPDVTVLSLGANEGYPMLVGGDRRLDCCGDEYEAELTRRYRQSIEPYLRSGRVVLLTIQLPRDRNRVPQFATANRAMVNLQDTPGVTVLRMDSLFTPDGYRESIVYRGREVDVREPDGIHLNVAGTAIAARAIADALTPLLSR